MKAALAARAALSLAFCLSDGCSWGSNPQNGLQRALAVVLAQLAGRSELVAQLVQLALVALALVAAQQLALVALAVV